MSLKKLKKELKSLFPSRKRRPESDTQRTTILRTLDQNPTTKDGYLSGRDLVTRSTLRRKDFTSKGPKEILKSILTSLEALASQLPTKKLSKTKTKTKDERSD
jgi:hypothetical protein